jgi:hypothetical protein
MIRYCNRNGSRGTRGAIVCEPPKLVPFYVTALNPVIDSPMINV